MGRWAGGRSNRRRCSGKRWGALGDVALLGLLGLLELVGAPGPAEASPPPMPSSPTGAAGSGVNAGTMSGATVGPAAPANPSPTAEDLHRARTLFGAGEKAEDEERWSDALHLFQQVADVKSTGGVLYHVALCEERLGLLASAFRDYAQALDRARSENNRAVRETVEPALAALKPRVPWLTVAWPGGQREVRLLVDGIVLSALPASSPQDTAFPKGAVPRIPAPSDALQRSTVTLPLDPGKHRLRAEAPGMVPDEEDVVADEGTTQVWHPRFQPEARPTPGPANLSFSGSAGVGSSLNRTGLALGAGAGALLLGAAGFGFYALAGSAQTDAFSWCTQSRGPCSDELKTKTWTFDALALGSWVGSLALATTALFLWPKPSASSPLSQSRLSPTSPPRPIDQRCSF